MESTLYRGGTYLLPASTHEVLGHACDVESLDAYDLVFVHEASGQLVQVVLALAGYVLVSVLVALFEGLSRCCRSSLFSLQKGLWVY